MFAIFNTLKSSKYGIWRFVYDLS